MTYSYGEKPPQWEIGRLIQSAREAAGLSQHQAAALAKSSASRWRQVEDGLEKVRGEWKETNPRPELLARMCHVLGIPAPTILQMLDSDLTVDDFDFPLTDERLDLDGLDNADMAALQAFVDFLKHRKSPDPSE